MERVGELIGAPALCPPPGYPPPFIWPTSPGVAPGTAHRSADGNEGRTADEALTQPANSSRYPAKTGFPVTAYTVLVSVTGLGECGQT